MLRWDGWVVGSSRHGDSIETEGSNMSEEGPLLLPNVPDESGWSGASRESDRADDRVVDPVRVKDGSKRRASEDERWLGEEEEE